MTGLFVTTDVLADFSQFYMVGALGNKTEKTIFDIGETPYLYFQFKPLSGADVNSTWTSPDTSTFFASIINTKEKEGWLNLDNWNEIRKEGLWNVSAEYITSNGRSGTGFTSFTVTPEPYAVVLFLVGALIMGLKLHHLFGCPSLLEIISL